MRKLANIARRVFGNSVQTSYFERFHWSILTFWTLQTAEHAVSPDFLITPGIRILGTGAVTLNSVQASYFERFHWPILNFWTLYRPWSMTATEHGTACSAVCSVQK
jgi:hypothetical protein